MKQIQSKKAFTFGVSALLLTGALAIPAHAQTAAADQSAQAPVAKQDSADTSTYATGQPLKMESKEGFWGHMNPLARKKWVKRQMDPVKERMNELDQLQSKNANDIRDVDSRATAGIKRANDAATVADQHAADAASRANAANTTAMTATTKTEALHGTVSNLDQYQTVESTPVAFASGRTTLGTKAKADLDEIATKLASEKGYIIEVQGYSRAGVGASTAMADSVVRYLVTEHQVPIYRIYRSGMGKAPKTTEDGQTSIRNGVRVTLLHNSLATMDGAPTVSSTSTPANSNLATGSTTSGSLQ